MNLRCRLFGHVYGSATTADTDIWWEQCVRCGEPATEADRKDREMARQ